MGICLSCLRPGVEEDEFNERSSLLGQQNRFANENYQEELLKQQQRQSELNGIVNDLSDKLIDVSAFLSANTTLQHQQLEQQDEEEEQEIRTIKDNILDEVNNLDDSIKKSCKVELSGPLFLKF